MRMCPEHQQNIQVILNEKAPMSIVETKETGRLCHCRPCLITLSTLDINRVWFTNSACGQLTKENQFAYGWSRELGSAVEFRDSPLIILNDQAESDAYRYFVLDIATSHQISCNC